MNLLIRSALLLAVLFTATSLAVADDSHGAAHGGDAIKVKGVVHAVSADKINASHEPIPELGWPKMTMDFAVSENVDLDAVPTETPVELELVKGDDGIYQVNAITAE